MDRLIKALALLLWSAGLACAAVSKETAPADVFVDSASSLSMTGYVVTCAGGSPLITASVLSEFEGENVTGVTYNALALTQKTELAIGGANGVVETWYRVGSTGTATLTASFSSGDWVGHLGAQAFCGVDQATPLGTSVTVTSGSETSLSLSVTVPANGMAMGAAFLNDGAQSKALAPQSGATEEWESSGVGSSCCSSGAGTTRTTTGDCGVTWDGAGQPAGLICTPINPVAAAAATRRAGPMVMQ